VQYGETDSYGSFTAQSSAFFYAYHAPLKRLEVARAGGKTPPLLESSFDEITTEDPLAYIRNFEKAAQIKALKFSNNTTVNLASTLDDQRLGGILSIVSQIALYACCLQGEMFGRFEKFFLRDGELKYIRIKKITDDASGDIHYTAQAETSRRHLISSKSSTLHGALSYLADKIMHDLVAREYGHGGDDWVYRLLHISSTLSILSFVLNDGFDPARKITGKCENGFSLADIQKHSLFQ
jgi:hypothetical protein